MPLSTISAARPITSYAKVQRALTPVFRNRTTLADWRTLRSKEYLDIGPGAKLHDHCAALDFQWRPGIHLCWDLNSPLPIDRMGVSQYRGIFTEHCLEHVPIEVGARVLTECALLLRGNGILRIIVPDLDQYARRYVCNEPMPLAATDPGIEGLYTPAMSINRIFLSHNHRFIYDYRTLSALLFRAGFQCVRHAHFRDSEDPLLNLDSPEREDESLYVEARLAGPKHWSVRGAPAMAVMEDH